MNGLNKKYKIFKNKKGNWKKLSNIYYVDSFFLFIPDGGKYEDS